MGRSPFTMYDFSQRVIKFAGYVKWQQDVTMSNDDENKAMNSACESSFAGSRAATYDELYGNHINGLAKPSEGDCQYTLLHSGDGDLWKHTAYSNNEKRKFYRNGWDKSK